MDSRSKWAFALTAAMGTAAVLAAACGSSAGTSSSEPPGADATTTGDDAYYPPFAETSAPDSATLTLTVQPQDQTIDVPPTATVQFQALGASGVVTAAWSVDAPAIGSIDQTGLFTPNGRVGGTLNVYAQAGALAGRTSLKVRVHVSDVPGGVDGGTLGALQAGGTADPAFKWLYPYDQTVWPRGLLPPRLQLTSAPPQWIYVKASAQYLDYQGVFGPTNTDGLAGSPTQLDLPASAWTTISGSAGPSDPVTVQVTKYAGPDAVTGPLTETWTVAQGTLKGIVYYNSYDSPLAQGDAGSGNDMGAVMRIKPGASQPDVFIGGAAKGSCTVCHTLSANGQTMALSAGHAYDAIYAVSADASSPVGPVSQQPDNVYSFGALTPDGKYLLSCGSTGLDAGYDEAGAPSIADYGPNVVSMTHELSSQLLDTSDGGVVVASLPGVPKALMPAFSPDGTKLVFNRFVAGGDPTLSIMPFTESTHTFGQYTDVFVDPGFFLSWPSFLPDSQGFVFQTSDSSDQYSTYDPVTYDDANGELFTYFAAINDVHHLRAAMGTVESTGATYLLNPDGTVADQDTKKNYEPTALPVASGGYYWVVFTSRRSYGNTIDNSNPNATPPNSPKKLWVTALDINGSTANDPSHPAFYLPGQELAAGNLRGFWTLEPCKSDGSSCQSGTECCDGFCRQLTGDGGATVCIAPPTGCANEDEKCAQTSDCCGAPANGETCINGFCARATPPK